MATSQTMTAVEEFQLQQTENENGNQPRNVSDTTSAEPKMSKWLVLSAAFMVIFVGVGFANSFGVFQEYYQTKLFPDIPSSQIILIGSVASSLYMILGAFTGRFADVFGYKTALTVGSVLIIGGLFAASASKQYYQFFLSQGLTFGLGVAFVYYPAVTISRQVVGSNRVAVANGFVLSGGALGGCILPYTVRVLLATRGLPETFRVLGYLATGILIPSTLLLKPRKSQPRSAGGSKALLDLSLLKDVRFLVVLAAGTVAMTGFLPRYFLVTPSAIHMGIDTTYAAWLLGIMNGLSIPGRLITGSFADRYGKLTGLITAFVLCGSGHILFWLPGMLVSGKESVTALMTTFVVYVGLLGSGFVSLIPVVMAHLFGSENLASKVGLLNSIMGLGVLAGPSAIYAIVSHGEDWSMGVLTSGLLMVVGGLALTRAYKYSHASG